MSIKDFLTNDDYRRRIEAKLNFGTKQRERVYRKIGSFLKNGVSLPETLRILYRISTDDGKNLKSPMAYIYREWLNRVNNGMTFGRAVEGWVPAGDRVIIDAGDASGKLEEALERAILIQKSGKQIKTAIIVGAAQPIVLLIMACFLMVIFGVRVIPAFGEAKPIETWTGLPADLALVSVWVRHYMLPTIVAFVGIVSFCLWTMPRWTGPLRAKFDKYPPWSIYRLNSGASFMLSVSALIKSGVKVPDVLRILMRSSTPWFFERMSETLKHVNNGKNIGDALYETKLWFPDEETVRDLRAYAALDNFDDNLEAVGTDLLLSSVERIKMQMNVLRNIAIVLLAIIFATILLGIFALQQMVTSAV